MLTFILHQIFSFRLKSLGIIGVIGIFTFLLAVLLFISRNTISVLEYYSPTTIDPSRVTFVSDTSIFDILSKDGGGINTDIVSEIKKDNIFSRTKIFTFIDTNIVGGFDIFTFHLDIDIPVFGLNDSSGDISGFGISPSMMHYYNLELAGSHPMFPVLSESFLKGKPVSLTFGASKIFQVQSPSSSPLLGSIESIDLDYPGFGIVAPLSKIEGKLQEIGSVVRRPYKIIAYMKDQNSRDEIEKRYSSLHPIFDKDLIDIRASQFQTIRFSIFSVGLFFSIIIISLLIVLFAGFFREKSSIFRLLIVFGVGFPYRQLILFGETVIFQVLGNCISLILVILSQYLFIPRLSVFLHAHGILFPLMVLSISDMLVLIGLSIIIISLLIFFTSRRRS